MNRALVLDANILIRACLGQRVLAVMLEATESCELFVPPSCIVEAQKHLPKIAIVRALSRMEFMTQLDSVLTLLNPVENSLIEPERRLATRRLRDADDWPVLAASFALKAPIWTEDQDFFGTGAATLTTRNVASWLSEFY